MWMTATDAETGRAPKFDQEHRQEVSVKTPSRTLSTASDGYCRMRTITSHPSGYDHAPVTAKSLLLTGTPASSSVGDLGSGFSPGRQSSRENSGQTSGRSYSSPVRDAWPAKNDSHRSRQTLDHFPLTCVSRGHSVRRQFSTTCATARETSVTCGSGTTTAGNAAQSDRGCAVVQHRCSWRTTNTCLIPSSTNAWRNQFLQYRSP